MTDFLDYCDLPPWEITTPCDVNIYYVCLSGPDNKCYVAAKYCVANPNSGYCQCCHSLIRKGGDGAEQGGYG